MSAQSQSLEQIYDDILKLFNEMDYEKVGRLMIEACNLIELNNGATVNKKDVIRNALLLLLGAMHKEEPLEEIGRDFWELDKNSIKKFLKEFKDTFI